MMGFGSDGASVMTGCKGGVGVRLQKHNLYLLCVHCIAHRLALCCADAAKDMDYPENEEAIVNNISAYFNRSGTRAIVIIVTCDCDCAGKRTVELQQVAGEFDLSRTKIVKSGATRWLSREPEGCVTVLLQLFPALAQLFRSAASSDDVAQTLYKGITSYMFAGVLVAMVDLLTVLGQLSRRFQADYIDYNTITSSLAEVRESILASFLRKKDIDASQFSSELSYDDWSKIWNNVLSLEKSGSVSSVFQDPSSENVARLLKSSDILDGVQLHDVDRDALIA